MKRLILSFLLLLPLGLLAETLQEGTPIRQLLIKDQFEKSVTITPQTKQIIIAFTKSEGESIKVFLEAHPHYLAENNTLYFMDATAVPSLVMSLFMMPKFKKYDYAIGLIENEKDASYFPKKEDRITVVTLENLTVKAIAFKEAL